MEFLLRYADPFDGFLEERDLEPFRYPALNDLRGLGYRSVCPGVTSWDVKMREKIRSELGWQGDVVENVPGRFQLRKIECWMQGVRDYIKYVSEVMHNKLICCH